MTEVSLDSLAVVKLSCMARETDAPLGAATGFFASHNGSIFLVTAWHVASGRHLETRKPLHESLALPGRIEFLVPIRMRIVRQADDGFAAGEGESFFVWHVPASINLPECMVEDNPHIHPSLGSKVDVVAFPVDAILEEALGRARDFAQKFPSDKELAPVIESFEINEQVDPRHKLRVMNTVFVPGFPDFRPGVHNGYPIYKSAFVASEPDIHCDLPTFLVDGKTKKGWSGAPILFDPSQNEIMGRSKRLVLAGVYSAREDVDPELYRAELGLGWKIRNALLPIIVAQMEAI